MLSRKTFGLGQYPKQLIFVLTVGWILTNKDLRNPFLPPIMYLVSDLPKEDYWEEEARVSNFPFSIILKCAYNMDIIGF